MSSGDVLPMLPDFPDVRCDKCRKVYTVIPPPEGGMINGMCPYCGHERFSTSFPHGHGVEDVAMYQLTVYPKDEPDAS